MESKCNQLSESATVRRALEKRGVSSTLAARLADALVPILKNLSAEEAEALIDGAELTSRITGKVAFEKPVAAIAGLENLFSDFATEIRKLDEGLRMLTSYAIQIRKEVDGQESETLH